MIQYSPPLIQKPIECGLFVWRELSEVNKIRKKKEEKETLILPPRNCMSVKQSFVIMGQAGGAMVLGQLQVPGRPTIRMIVGQGPIAFAVGAGGACLDIFILLHLFFPLSGRWPDIG